jgi:hypothetical protein
MGEAPWEVRPEGMTEFVCIYLRAALRGEDGRGRTFGPGGEANGVGLSRRAGIWEGPYPWKSGRGSRTRER